MAQKKLGRGAVEVSATVRMRIALRLNIYLCHITCVPAEAREKNLSKPKPAYLMCEHLPWAESNTTLLPD